MNNIKGIHAYVYNSKRHPIGVLAAQPSTANVNEVIIGWSRCNAAAGDRFDRKRGVEIAYSRSATGSLQDIPESMKVEYTQFMSRTMRYFRDKNVLC